MMHTAWCLPHLHASPCFLWHSRSCTGISWLLGCTRLGLGERLDSLGRKVHSCSSASSAARRICVCTKRIGESRELAWVMRTAGQPGAEGELLQVRLLCYTPHLRVYEENRGECCELLWVMRAAGQPGAEGALLQLRLLCWTPHLCVHKENRGERSVASSCG